MQIRRCKFGRPSSDIALTFLYLKIVLRIVMVEKEDKGADFSVALVHGGRRLWICDVTRDQ